MIISMERSMEEKKYYMCYSVSPPKGTPMQDYYTDKLDIRSMKQKVVAFKGRYVVVAEADEFWGGKESKQYQSRVLVDPTWGQLFKCAKAAQKKTNDLHHSFFEGAGVRKIAGVPKTMEIRGETVTVLELHLGS
jgi:hypothetical protein